MPRVTIAFALLLACCLGSWSRARAADAPKTVVMVVDPRVAPLALRLEQEIESLGLLVKVVPSDAPEAAGDAARLGVVAAIRVAPMGGGDVDLTILDSATGKTVSWKLVAPGAGEAAASELIATRTVELLRASLLELARRPALALAARPAASAAAPVTAAEPEKPSSLALSLGPAALYSNKFRPGAELQAAITWLPFQHFGFTAAALAPLVPPRLSSRQGAVDLFASLFRLGAVAALVDEQSPVSLRVAAGVELDKLRFEGRALEPYQSAGDSRTTWSPFLGVTPRFRVAAHAYVVTELVVALASPTTVVRVAGHEVAEFGRPFGTAALALELTWPRGTP